MKTIILFLALFSFLPGCSDEPVPGHSDEPVPEQEPQYVKEIPTILEKLPAEAKRPLIQEEVVEILTFFGEISKTSKPVDESSIKLSEAAGSALDELRKELGVRSGKELAIDKLNDFFSRTPPQTITQALDLIKDPKKILPEAREMMSQLLFYRLDEYVTLLNAAEKKKGSGGEAAKKKLDELKKILKDFKQKGG